MKSGPRDVGVVATKIVPSRAWRRRSPCRLPVEDFDIEGVNVQQSGGSHADWVIARLRNLLRAVADQMSALAGAPAHLRISAAGLLAFAAS